MEREPGVWPDFISPSVQVRIGGTGSEKGTRKHRNGDSWTKLSLLPWGRPAQRRLQVAEVSPPTWFAVPGWVSGRAASATRVPSAPRTRPRTWSSENIGDRGLVCPCPLGSPPSAPNQRIRRGQRRDCFPKANNQQFCFFFPTQSGVQAALGSGRRQVPP